MTDRNEPGLPGAQIHARGLGGRVRRWSATGRYLRATYGLVALSIASGIVFWQLRSQSRSPRPRLPPIEIPIHARPSSSLAPGAALELTPPQTVPATASTIVPGALIYYRDQLSLGPDAEPWSAGVVDTVNPSGTFTVRGDDRVRTIATARVLVGLDR